MKPTPEPVRLRITREAVCQVGPDITPDALRTGVDCVDAAGKPYVLTLSGRDMAWLRMALFGS